MVLGGVWAQGVHGSRGMHGAGGCMIPGGGCMVPGGCMVQGGWWRPPPDGYYWGRYASYWNAFLFSILSMNSNISDVKNHLNIMLKRTFLAWLIVLTLRGWHSMVHSNSWYQLGNLITLSLLSSLPPVLFTSFVFTLTLLYVLTLQSYSLLINILVFFFFRMWIKRPAWYTFF